MSAPDRALALKERYLAAKLDGDRREALRVIMEEGIAKGMTAVEAQELIRDAQQEIGRLWQEDRITIAQEHMATAIAQVVLSHVYQHATPRERNGKRVLVACVEGELHDFPARLVADALDLAGFEARFLGANVPTDALVRMIGEQRPHLLVLSATIGFHLTALRDAIRRVREASPKLPIAVGGAACAGPVVRAQLAADITGHDAEELVREAKQLLRVVD